MNSRDFTYWLEGYLNQSESLTTEQIQMIKDVLQKLDDRVVVYNDTYLIDPKSYKVT